MKYVSLVIKGPLTGVEVTNIAFDKLDPLDTVLEILASTGRQVVEDRYVGRKLEQAIDQVRTDETSSARHHDRYRFEIGKLSIRHE